MVMMTIIRDAGGAVINIGAWDHGAVRTTTRDDTGAVSVTETITNPLPAGAWEDTADVVTAPDGARYLAGDPRLEGDA